MTTERYVTHEELAEILKPIQDALRGASPLDVQYRHLATKGDLEALEARLGSRMDSLEANMASKADVQVLRSDVQELKSDVQELKELILTKL